MPSIKTKIMPAKKDGTANLICIGWGSFVSKQTRVIIQEKQIPKAYMLFSKLVLPWMLKKHDPPNAHHTY